MNPPLDIIPQNEWYCSQCAKIMPNLKYNNFNNTNNSEKKIQSRDNLRKRVKHSIAIFNEVRIPTRSFYTDKKFEYKELDDEILLHELKNESLLNKYIFGNNEKTKHIKNKIRTRSNKFNDEESEKEKAELASKIRNNTIKTKNLVKKMIRKNK